MGLNTLNNRTAGQTILDTFFNDLNQAFNGDFVGRNTSGVPTLGQNLGTVALPWGTGYMNNLILNGSPIDASLITSPANRIVSGKKRTTSNQPAFITPSGSGATATIAATATNLVLNINGSTVSVVTDIALSGLTLAPSSQNTATVNDAVAAGQDSTRRWGENDFFKKITMTSAGTNITALVGKYACFKIGTEYFIAFVESSTVLSRAYRGYFYNNSLAPLNRVTFSNSATITLMSLGWVFVENNGTTAGVSYTVPAWDFVAPSSPAVNDYWYDLANSLWKRYDGASWVIINRTLVGNVVLDSTNCVAARCQDFYAKYDAKNTVEVEIGTSAICQTSRQDCAVNVAGRDYYLGRSPVKWNITTQLAGVADMYSSTEQASTYYFLYLKDTGECVISDISPYIRPDLFGRYHPHNPWRCIARIYNDGSSNITRISAYANPKGEKLKLITVSGTGSTATFVPIFSTINTNTIANIEYATSAAQGMSMEIMEEGEYTFRGQFKSASGDTMGMTRNSTSLASACDIATNPNELMLVTWAPNTETSSYAETTIYCKAGEVIRHHGGPSGTSTTTNANQQVAQCASVAMP